MAHISTSRRRIYASTTRRPDSTALGWEPRSGWPFSTPCTAALLSPCLCMSESMAVRKGYGVAMETTYQVTGPMAAWLYSTMEPTRYICRKNLWLVLQKCWHTYYLPMEFSPQVFVIYGKRGGLMVSTLDSGSSGPGFVVFRCKTLWHHSGSFTQVYKQVSLNSMLVGKPAMD